MALQHCPRGGISRVAVAAIAGLAVCALFARSSNALVIGQRQPQEDAPQQNNEPFIPMVPFLTGAIQLPFDAEEGSGGGGGFIDTSNLEAFTAQQAAAGADGGFMPKALAQALGGLNVTDNESDAPSMSPALMDHMFSGNSSMIGPVVITSFPGLIQIEMQEFFDTRDIQRYYYAQISHTGIWYVEGFFSSFSECKSRYTTQSIRFQRACSADTFREAARQIIRHDAMIEEAVRLVLKTGVCRSVTAAAAASTDAESVAMAAGHQVATVESAP